MDGVLIVTEFVEGGGRVIGARGFPRACCNMCVSVDGVVTAAIRRDLQQRRKACA